MVLFIAAIVWIFTIVMSLWMVVVCFEHNVFLGLFAVLVAWHAMSSEKFRRTPNEPERSLH